MKNDELLRFIHEARTDDFYEGKHRLNFGTYINHFSSNEERIPPSTNASMAIGPEGPFWIGYLWIFMAYLWGQISTFDNLLD